MDPPASMRFLITMSTHELSNWLRPFISPVLMLTVTVCSLGELGMAVIPYGVFRFERERSIQRSYAPTPLSCRKKKKKSTQNDLLYRLEYITFVVNYKRKRLSGPLQSSRVEAHLLFTPPEMLLDPGRAGSSLSWACCFVKAPWLPEALSSLSRNTGYHAHFLLPSCALNSRKT